MGLSLASASLVTLTSCTSGTEEDTTGIVDTGVTASEFASGSVIMDVRGASSIIVRPTSSPEKVDAFATRAVGVEGVLQFGEESVPVFYTYESQGDLLTTGVLTAEISVSLNGVEYVQNTTLLSALGAPLNGGFLSATIYVDYLAQTVSIESRVLQPISIDPDGLGAGIIITGVSQTQTSTIDNIKFFFQEV